MREILQAQLRDIYDHPEIRHVMHALAALMRREKGQILFSGNPNGVGALGEPYGAASNVLGGVAGFQRNHTVYGASTVNPYESTRSQHSVATFVHESLHMLFGRLIGANRSPVVPGTPEAAALDAALDADRQHRATLDPTKFSYQDRRAHQTMTFDLQLESNYFPGGFNPDNPSHQEIMRTEAIVRPIEQIALGATPEVLEKIMPNLWAFYQEHARPILEGYAAQAVEDGLLASPPPVAPKIAAVAPVQAARASVEGVHVGQGPQSRGPVLRALFEALSCFGP